MTNDTDHETTMSDTNDPRDRIEQIIERHDELERRLDAIEAALAEREEEESDQ